MSSPAARDPDDASVGRLEPGVSWVSTVRSAAHDLEELLADPEQLSRVTAQLMEFAVASGAGMVTGSSALGNQLAGLVVGRATSPMSLWAQNGARGTVLVIEGVLASGAQMSQTARRARDAGAARVVGAAVVAEPNGLAACRIELGDEVRALGSLELA